MNKDIVFPTQRIISSFLRNQENVLGPESFEAYKLYYDRTWKALKSGDPPEAEKMANIDHDHTCAVVESISEKILSGGVCYRKQLREDLQRTPLFYLHSDESINRTIDLALRLWLALNIRDDDFAPGMYPVQWDDQTPLHTFIARQFPQSKFELGVKFFDYALPDSFTMVKLKRYSGIKVDWTDDLSEHLDFDGDHRILKVFPLKYYMYCLRKSKVEIIPNNVLDEYIKTMNLLFPSWDIKTQKFLKKKQQTFGLEGPVDYPGPLYLSDFHFWRDKLSALYTEFSSPPPSMTQLFNDRRNVLQWYTFWFAVLIVGLTIIFGVISSVASCLSTKYAYEALLLARDSASCIYGLPSSPVPS